MREFNAEVIEVENAFKALEILRTPLPPDCKTLVPNRMFRNAGGKYFQEVTGDPLGVAHKIHRRY